MNNEARRKCLSLLERTEFYDDEGELRIAGSDWLLMSGATIRSWAKITEQVLGSGAMVIEFTVGKRAGEHFAGTLLKEGLEKKALKYALEVFLTNGGWGKARARVNFQKREAVVRIRNSVTTRQTKANEPVCHFIRGYIAGFSNVMFGSNAECVETKCTATGYSFCEFRVDVSNQSKSLTCEKVEGACYK
jgi:predicted hydrocarbon binding protein